MTEAATTAATMYRLEVFRDNRGTWRWRARGPEGVFAHSASLYALRDEARADGDEYLLERGLAEGTWSVWMDGLSEHVMMPSGLPRVNPVEEAKRAGLPTPPDMEEVNKVHRELEARKQAALEAAQLARESVGADEGMAPDKAPSKAAPSEPQKADVEKNPLVQQARKRGKAKEA